MNFEQTTYDVRLKYIRYTVVVIYHKCVCSHLCRFVGDGCFKIMSDADWQRVHDRVSSQ